MDTDHRNYKSIIKSDKQSEQLIEHEEHKILCNHCGRTQNNGLRCLGMCIADSDY